MSRLQSVDENDSNTFPTSSTWSPQGIHPADASPNRGNHPESNDASLDMPPPEDSPPSQSGTPISKQLLVAVRAFAFIFILIALSPLLVPIFLFMRLLQFIRHDRGYYNATLLKLSTRSWISLAIGGIGLFSLLSTLHLGLTTSNWSTVATKKLDQRLSILPSWLYGVTFAVGFVGHHLQIILCRIIPYQSTFGYQGFYLRDRVLEILDCLFLCLLESNIAEHVPSIKHHNILGLHTYKWIQVSLFVFVAYNVITLFTWVIVWVLQQLVPKTLGPSSNDTIIEYSMGGKYIVYCANGLRNSINFILIALMLLLTWGLYFGSHLSDTPKANKVLEIGTQTCVSVLVCSVLWLIKTCVLLSWEVSAVYNRMSSELIHGGNQLYFLGLICRQNHDIFGVTYKVPRKDDIKEAEEINGHMSLSSTYINKMVPLDIKWTAIITSPTLMMLRSLDVRTRSNSDSEEEDGPKQGTSSLKNDEDGNKKREKKLLSRKVKERVRDDVVMQDANLTPTLHATQVVAQYFLSAREALAAHTFTSTTHLEDENKIIKESLMKQLIDGENNQSDANQQSSKGRELKHKWEHFLESQLRISSQQLEHPTRQITEKQLSERIKAWMERSRNNCLFLANTLYSAQEVVDCLNRIISLLVIAATLIMWLLLTGFATTKVFVLIASPLLAATFIFGDTCKSLFQGIMFVYVVHPFHIGDLCFLDGKMMEVWMVGVWKTTFKEVVTRAEVIYTNTELSTKNIVNHKTGFDWNDSIELEVSSLDTNQIAILEGKIKKHLNDPKQNFKSSHNCVKVLTAESNLKMTISFQHIVEDLEANSTNFECVKRKQELLSQLTLKLHDFLEETKRNHNLQFYT